MRIQKRSNWAARDTAPERSWSVRWMSDTITRSGRTGRIVPGQIVSPRPDSASSRVLPRSALRAPAPRLGRGGGPRGGLMNRLDVGIIGCGTAGPAAALLLARAGHRVTVYERVAEPGPVGAGILLQPTGQAVLARLGLLERVRARAAPVDRLLCQRTGGRAVVDLRYAEIGAAVGLGIHRGVLFQALFDALSAEEGVRLELGFDVERVEVDGARRWVV